MPTNDKFFTRPSFSRQLNQYSGTTGEFSGSSTFKEFVDIGTPLANLATGINSTTTGVSSTITSESSNFTANTNTSTNTFNFSTAEVQTESYRLSALTTTNSATTQTISLLFSATTTYTAEGNTYYDDYTGVTYTFDISTMTLSGSGVYTGTCTASTVSIYSGLTHNWIRNKSGSTIFLAVSGGTQTEELYVDNAAIIGGDLNVTGSTIIKGDLTILGTATTMNTETIQAEDNNIDLNYGGNNVSAQYGGIRLLYGVGASTHSSITAHTSGIWVLDPGLSSHTATITGQLKYTNGTPGAGKWLQSDAVGNASWVTNPCTACVYVSGGTYTSGNIQYTNTTGGTFSVDVTALTADTHVFVTGGTYSAPNLTYTNNSGGTFSINVNALLDDTNSYVTGATMNSNTLELERSGGLSDVLVDLSQFDSSGTEIFVTGGTYSAGNITQTNITGGTYNIDVTALTADTHVFVTGGTYGGGNLSFTNYTGGTFQVGVSALLDDTNNYVTGATMNGNTLELKRKDGLSDVTVNLSQFIDDTNTHVFVTGGTYSAGNLQFTNLTGGSFTINVSALIDDTNNYLTGATMNGDVLELERHNLSDVTVNLSQFNTPLYWSATTSGDIVNSGTTNNVGIGNTNPNHELSVTGSISGTSDLYVDGTINPGINALKDVIATGTSIVIANNGIGSTPTAGSGADNLVIGHGSLNNGGTGTNNIVLGRNSGLNKGGGSFNIMIGKQVLGSSATSSPSGNTMIGHRTGFNFWTGHDNVVLGHNAGSSGTFSRSVVLGVNAGNLQYGNNQTILGYNAGADPDNWYNTSTISPTYIGAYAGYNVHGHSNIAIGSEAGYNKSVVTHYTGTSNIMIGNGVLLNSSGSTEQFVLGSLNKYLASGVFTATSQSKLGINISNDIPTANLQVKGHASDATTFLVEDASNTQLFKVGNTGTIYSGTTDLLDIFCTAPCGGGSDDNTYVTGGTYSAGNIQFTNLTGGTFNVGVSALLDDTNTHVFVTGGTYSSGDITFTNLTGGTFDVDVNSLLDDTNSYVTSAGMNGDTLELGRNGGLGDVTVSLAQFNSGSDSFVTGGTYSAGNITQTNSTGGTFNIDVTALTADTHVFVTGGTYSAPNLTYTNNTGGTFNINVNTLLDDTNNYLTGATMNGNVLELERHNMSDITVNLSQFVDTDTHVFVTGGTADDTTSTLTLRNSTGGTFTVANSALLFNDAYVSGGTLNGGTVTFTNTTGGTFNVGGFNGFDSYWSASTNGHIVNSGTTGNVGIGTIEPIEKLHVSGQSATYTKIESNSSHAGLILDSDTGDNAFIDYKENGTLKWRNGLQGADDSYFKWSSGTTFVNDTVMAISKNGYLGVGTGDPQTRLHIVAPEGADAVIRIETDRDNSGGETDNPRIEFVQDGGILESAIGHNLTGNAPDQNTFEIANSVSAGGILFNTAGVSGYQNATARMFITNDGKVGIGNTHPNNALGVTGTISATTKVISGALQITTGANNGYVLKSDVSGNATWQAESGGGTDDQTLAEVLAQGNDANNLEILNVNGIRIGSAGSPGTWGVWADKIYVSDYLRADGGIKIGSAGDPGTDNLVVDGTSFLTGNVGIGNDHPSHELGVTGSISASTKVISAALQITTSPTNGHVLTSDGSGNATWQAASGGVTKYTESKALTAGVTGTVTHSLGTTDVVVQVKNPSGNLVAPGTVGNYQTNAVDITVSVTGTYRIIIMG